MSPLSTNVILTIHFLEVDYKLQQTTTRRFNIKSAMWANFMEINKKNCVVQRVEQTILLEIKFNSIRRVDLQQ